MGKEFQGKIEQIDANRWRIPKESRPDMRVDGIIYSSESLISEVLSGGGAVQVANVATLPGIVSASLAMPDIHWGYGFCIGGVAATDIDQGGVVSPGGVGYDINCGVRLLRSDMAAEDVRPRMKQLVDQLFRDVPAGVGVGGSFKFDRNEMRHILSEGVGYLASRGLADGTDVAATESGGQLGGADPDAVSDRAFKRGFDQCGTLGSGNHFVEVQYVEQVYDAEGAAALGLEPGKVAVMIHSGSRGLGHQVCQDYIKLLRSAPQRYGITLPDRQLVCAPADSSEGRRYLSAMAAAANFAWCNRQLLAVQVRRTLERFFGEPAESLGLRQVYDVAHNIAKIETHAVDGERRRLCVHRKGATRAFGPGEEELPAAYRRIGQPVLIPGDMGTASYVLLGTEQAMRQSFGSTCHGAGRVLSRHEAIRQAAGRHIDKELAEAGVFARARGRRRRRSLRLGGGAVQKSRPAPPDGCHQGITAEPGCPAGCSRRNVYFSCKNSDGIYYLRVCNHHSRPGRCQIGVVMAFAFFRRRQKMVLIIMVVLMVSFLVGLQGFSMLFSAKSQQNIPVGRVGDHDIIQRDLNRAGGDLNILSRLRLSKIEFLILLSNGRGNKELAYALLLHEAENSGVRVTDADVDAFFQGVGLVGAGYNAALSELRSSQKINEKQLRAIVARWIMVQKTFIAAEINSPPSEPQIRRLYRDLSEKVGLEVAKIPAEMFLKEVPEPTADQIDEQFNRFKAEVPRTYTSLDSFGFGYRQPASVNIEYIFIDHDAIERATQIPDKSLRDHYRRNREKYVREIPATVPATLPATVPASATADSPEDAATRQVEHRTMRLSFAEAKDKIKAELLADAVGAKLDEFTNRVEMQIVELADIDQIAPDKIYEQIVADMTESAHDLLARKIDVTIAAEPLSEAIGKLADEAALVAICYPWGTHGDQKLSPSVRVTLKAEGITLGEALRRITQQVKWPEIKWATCRGFEGVLFPVDGEAGAKLFPIRIGRSGLMDYRALSEDEVLGSSFTISGQPLAEQAFRAEMFDAARRRPGGVEGPQMQVSGPTKGRLLWRIKQAIPAHEPGELNEDIRRQVVEDIKVTKAMLLARQKAEQIAAAAEKTDLASAAKAADAETTDTDLFGRKILSEPRRQLEMLAYRFGRPEYHYRAMLSPAYSVNWNQVTGLEMPSPQLRQYLMEKVFALAPEDVEPPYPPKSSPMVLSLPPRREVVVIRRNAYRASLQSDYEQGGRMYLARVLMVIRQDRTRALWFTLPGIQRRLRFAKQ